MKPTVPSLRPRSTTVSAGIAAVMLLATAAPAFAYVGPGAGLSLLGALWALVAAVFAAVGFVVMWPIRKMLKNRRRAAASTTAQQASATSRSAAEAPRPR